MAASLTKMQEAFLDHLFDEKNGFDPKKAMKLAGYKTDRDSARLLKDIAPFVVERTQEYLAVHGPEAAYNLIGIIRDPTQIGAKERLAGVTQVLDRIGIVKHEKVEVTGPGGGGLLILPALKKEDEAGEA